CPSGVQPCTMSAPGCHVSRFGSPPSIGSTYTSVLPPYWALNATVLPSGENAGFVSCPWKLVRRRAAPPSRPTIQMSLPYSNAMCVALSDGLRTRRVGSGSAPDRPLPFADASVCAAEEDANTVRVASRTSPALAAGRREVFMERSGARGNGWGSGRTAGRYVGACQDGVAPGPRQFGRFGALRIASNLPSEGAVHPPIDGSVFLCGSILPRPMMRR